MSLIDVARDTLKEIPMADILRERLSLALDRLDDAERSIGVLQADLGSLRAQLEIERSARHASERELRLLKEEHAEETRILRGFEFRRSRRTEGKWLPFCPKCHMPIHEISLEDGLVGVCSGRCGWMSNGPLPPDALVDRLGTEKPPTP
jgi:hypothetical protein